MSGKLRVMVVDDEPIVGKRLGPALTKLGCSIECFVDPSAALARLARRRLELGLTANPAQLVPTYLRPAL